MTRLALLATLALAAGAAHAGPTSNPAFLGIEMRPYPSGVLVSGVTRGSAAAEAGVRMDDIIVAMDDTRIVGLDQLSAVITSHAPGDEVSITLLRGGQHVTVRARLLTRAEVLHRRFVDQPLDLEVEDYDDGTTYNLGSLRGDVRVLAFFNAEHCEGCESVIRKLAEAASRKRYDGTPKLLAVTYATKDIKQLAPMRLTSTLDMPVAIGAEAFFEQSSLAESDRTYFMVVDRRGAVRFVTPIASDADDIDAQLEDVLAAAEHCVRR